MKLNLTQSNLMALILGLAGSGKTRLAASTGIKTFYILTEKQGMETLRICQNAGLIHPETHFELIETWQEWETLIYNATFKDTARKYALTVLDTIDDLDDRIGDSIAASKGYTALAEIEDYGRSRATASARLQTHVINPLRSLDCDVVVLGHVSQKETGKGDDKVLTSSVRVSGKQEEVLSQKFNLICHLEKVSIQGQIKRKLVIRSKSDKLTKDHPAFQDVEEADLAMIIKKFKNYGVETPAKGEKQNLKSNTTKEPQAIDNIKESADGVKVSTVVRTPPKREEKKPESLLDLMPTPPELTAEEAKKAEDLERMKSDPTYRPTFEQFGQDHNSDPKTPTPPAAPSAPATPRRRRQ